MRLDPIEPAADAWRPHDEAGLAELVCGRTGQGPPILVVVDGRSGGGKSTFAALLARAVDGTVVHTDDVAWNHDAFDWADLLVAGVVEPWRRGEAVDYRPPGWVTHDRAGEVSVPRGATALVVEGVGAARAELAALADLVIWVQSDAALARSRGISRDIELGRTRPEAESFWDGWMAAEDPFLSDDRPWTRADLIVCGTPPAGTPQDVALVADGPLRAVG